MVDYNNKGICPAGFWTDVVNEVLEKKGSFTKSSKEAIRLLYGFSSTERKTFLEVSELTNLSPERIRQIDAKFSRHFTKLCNKYIDEYHQTQTEQEGE